MTETNAINKRTETLEVTSRTQNSVPYYGASGSLEEIGPLTNGQLPIGSTGNAPAASTLTAGAGISIVNGAGSITISGTASPEFIITGQTIAPGNLDIPIYTLPANAMVIAYVLGVGGYQVPAEGYTGTRTAGFWNNAGVLQAVSVSFGNQGGFGSSSISISGTSIVWRVTQSVAGIMDWRARVVLVIEL